MNVHDTIEIKCIGCGKVQRRNFPHASENKCNWCSAVCDVVPGQPIEDFTGVENCISECPPARRGSGRTQWMIDQLCDVVALGQPRSRVFAHTMDAALHELKPRIIEGLKRRGLKIDASSRCDRIFAEGSEILLCSTDLPKSRMKGFHGYGDFVDHFADGEM